MDSVMLAQQTLNGSLSLAGPATNTAQEAVLRLPDSLGAGKPGSSLLPLQIKLSSWGLWAPTSKVAHVERM